MITIERIERLEYKDFYENYYKKNKPVVITGMMDDWYAMKNWTSDYMKSITEDSKVSVTVSKTQSTIKNPEKGWLTKRDIPMGFHEFIDAITNNEKNQYYYLQWQKFEGFDRLMQDFEIPHYVKNTKDLHTRLWIGSGTNITPLHYDRRANILAQIKGSKKFIFFPPEETPNLYPFSFFSKSGVLSQVDLNQPNFIKYPNLNHAKRIEVEVNPGEMLFSPVHWWHQVETLSNDMTISVNFMWRSLPWHYIAYFGMRLKQGSLNGVKHS